MAEEYKVELSDQVKDKMESNPDIAAAIKDFIAVCHQVKDGMDRGIYKSFDEGMEAVTGNRPIPINLDDEEE